MVSNIELQDLSHRTSPTSPQDSRSSAAPTGPDVTNSDERDQSVAVWAYGATALLSVFALALIFTPGVLLFASETATDRRNILTPLESFLALHGGIFLLAFVMAILFNVPAQTIVSKQTKASIGHPLLVPLTIACTMSALFAYNSKPASSLTLIVSLGAATLGGWGMWTILFAGSSYHSRKTGADKRTSKFLFGNKAAASAQKKEWKKGQSTLVG